jgi:hypothetical protein
VEDVGQSPGEQGVGWHGFHGSSGPARKTKMPTRR